MRIKNKKVILLGGIACVALCIALPLATTLARYAKGITGYTNFEAERFNAAILFPTVAEEEPMVMTLSTQNFKPGMVSSFGVEGQEDTAAHLAFQVANGTSASDATSTALQYTVRIRTAQSLPLKYTLKSGDLYYEAMPNPTIITNGQSETRYEYTFHPVPKGSSQQAGPDDLEAKFELPRGTTQQMLVTHDHELIVEWPIDGDQTAVSYMKEIEIIEIVVTVTSLNNLDDPEYNKIPENMLQAYYAKGMILLLPPEDSVTEKTYAYEVDIRSFQKKNADAEEGVFNFTLNNAVGMGALHTKREIEYNMLLKVPVDLLDAAYSFKLYADNGEDVPVDLMEGLTPTYRLYDLETGEYQAYESRENVPSYDGKRYKLYAMYDLGLEANNVLRNEVSNTTGGFAPQNDTHKYSLSVNKLTGEKNELAFDNKLELFIEAVFQVDSTITPPAQGEATP